MNSKLILSGVVSFVFYFTWAYWVNSGEGISAFVSLKSALVQGGYSGFVTLFFTYILEEMVKKTENSCLSLAFVTPIICKFHSKTPQNIAIRKSFNNAINYSATFLTQAKVSAVFFAPIIPIVVQSSLVVAVNLLNETPNVLLTVAPSIFFTTLYAYGYLFSLLKNK